MTLHIRWKHHATQSHAAKSQYRRPITDPTKVWGILVAAFVAAMSNVTSRPQSSSQFLSRTSPRPSFQAPEPANYNIRIWNLQANLYGSIQTEYNDNFTLSQSDPMSDLSVTPYGRVGFVWRITEEHFLDFNVGLGYQYHLNAPSVSSISIDPNTHIEHTIKTGSVQTQFSDRFSIQTDPTSRADISGNGQDVLNFRILNNTIGLASNWEPTRNSTLTAGYHYSLWRSLSGQFTALDRDEHHFDAGLFVTRSSRHTLGLTASYGITGFIDPVQNNEVQFSIGPNWRYELSRFMVLNASVAYTTATFDQSGSIQDRSGFSGLTYNGGISHRMNSRFTHELQFSDSVDVGLGNNFNETTAVQYKVRMEIARGLQVNASASYELVRASGTHETANRFLFYAGTTYQLTRHWTAGLAYATARKTSNIPSRDYTQNRITLDLTRRF